MKQALVGVIALLFVPGVFAVFPHLADAPPGTAQVATVSEVLPNSPRAVSILLTGDIMLGRAVEGLMEEHGAGYPLRSIRELTSFPDLTVGNFEGVVAREHVRAPSMTFRFSVKNEYLTELRDAGFDVLSLANNHSLDYGDDALAHTKELCGALVLSCGGIPDGVDLDSFLVEEVNGERIGFLFLSTVWGDVDPDVLSELLSRARAGSDFLIAYVHWGEEYVLTHGEKEEALAHVLIDGGADVVVGHHPHVVQDVAVYRGKPIFYSLGNFIFDQYFSEEVMEGLVLGLTLTEDVARYRLIPVRNDTARSQPHTVSESEAKRLFARILGGTSGMPGVEVETGLVAVPRSGSEPIELQIPAM